MQSGDCSEKNYKLILIVYMGSKSGDFEHRFAYGRESKCSLEAAPKKKYILTQFVNMGLKAGDFEQRFAYGKGK
jgi:hypothetical protein